ncbi:MAG: C4-dicarboxylate ABC transporter [Sedimenticola sp.]|jgi:tellurite resistance protein|nr:MAG: C4-dicarboxylate ABC transporter [Sedimenticola sp.]
MDNSSRIQHFPISFFAIVMGLAGLTIAWEKAQHVLQLGFNMSGALTLIVSLVFVLILAMYLTKLVTFRDEVIKELNHPVKLNFFAAISISLILLSVVFLNISHELALMLWMVGSVLQLVFTLYVMNAWIHHEHYQIQHSNPAWFIPVVGNVLVPISGTGLGYFEISWFFFSIGMVFWLVLLTIIMNRVFFHNPLPAKLMPTFFILIAPPAVGFVAYVKLTGDIDAFARVLYYIGLFLTLLLLTQLRRFVKIQFFLSWWAYSFPLAAITIATLVMYSSNGIPAFAALSWVLLSLVSLVVVMLLYKTAKAISIKGICLPED